MTKQTKQPERKWEDDINQISRRLARQFVEMVGTDESSAYLLFKKEIRSLLKLFIFNVEEQTRQQTLEEVERVAYEVLGDNGLGINLIEKIVDQLLNQLKEINN